MAQAVEKYTPVIRSGALFRTNTALADSECIEICPTANTLTQIPQQCSRPVVQQQQQSYHALVEYRVDFSRSA